jgi:hypothetical protein
MRGSRRKACMREEARHETRQNTRMAAADPCAHKRGKAKKTCEHSAKGLRGRKDVADSNFDGEDAAPAHAAKGGGYIIQVGAYRSKSDAKAQIAKVSSRYGSAVSAGSGAVAAGGGGYRARFTGFSAAEAKTACKKLSARGERCMVMSAS